MNSNAYPMQALAVVVVVLGTLMMASWVFADGKLSASANFTGAGTARVDESLRTNASGISDTDDRTDTEFNYQWVAKDASSDTELSGAVD